MFGADRAPDDSDLPLTRITHILLAHVQRASELQSIFTRRSSHPPMNLRDSYPKVKESMLFPLIEAPRDTVFRNQANQTTSTYRLRSQINKGRGDGEGLTAEKMKCDALKTRAGRRTGFALDY